MGFSVANVEGKNLSADELQTYITEDRNWRTRIRVWKRREARMSSNSLTMMTT